MVFSSTNKKLIGKVNRMRMCRVFVINQCQSWNGGGGGGRIDFLVTFISLDLFH